MKSLDFLQAQQRLAKIMRDVNQEHEPVLIDGLGEHQAVLLSHRDYQDLLKHNLLNQDLLCREEGDLTLD